MSANFSKLVHPLSIVYNIPNVVLYYRIDSINFQADYKLLTFTSFVIVIVIAISGPNMAHCNIDSN